MVTAAIEAVPIPGGRRAGAEVTVRVLREARIFMLPKDLAGLSIEAEDVIVLGHVAHGVEVTVADGEGGVTDADAALPKFLWSFGGPIGQPAGFLGNAIAVGGGPLG